MSTELQELSEVLTSIEFRSLVRSWHLLNFFEIFGRTYQGTLAWGQCVWYVHRQLLLPRQRTMNTGHVRQLCLNGPTKRKSQGSKSWTRCSPKRQSSRNFSFFFTFLELEVVHIINGSISLHGFLYCPSVPSLSTIYTCGLNLIIYVIKLCWQWHLLSWQSLLRIQIIELCLLNVQKCAPYFSAYLWEVRWAYSNCGFAFNSFLKNLFVPNERCPRSYDKLRLDLRLVQALPLVLAFSFLGLWIYFSCPLLSIHCKWLVT